jgi:hypothetical protein
MYDKLVSLSKYLKTSSIKNMVGENYIYIDSLEDAEKIAYNIAWQDIMECKNIVFETSTLKNRFFAILEKLRPDTSIINCTSTLKRFKDKVNEASNLVIYNNINKCDNSDILDIIKENKGIFVC